MGGDTSAPSARAVNSASRPIWASTTSVARPVLAKMFISLVAPARAYAPGWPARHWQRYSYVNFRRPAQAGEDFVFVGAGGLGHFAQGDGIAQQFHLVADGG